MKPARNRRLLQSAIRSARFRPCLLCLEDRLLLSTYTVDSLGDTGNGSGTSGDFRYCLIHAASGDSITFDVTGTIDLTRPLPTLSGNLTITGPGAASLTVERGSTGTFRIFNLAAGSTIAMSGLTIANGNELQGGGILNSGNLTLTDTVFRANVATDLSGSDVYGGAIDNGGTLTVMDSVFEHNSVTGYGINTHADGAAIYNASGKTANISGSAFNGNMGQYGSAINNDGGTLTINVGTFTNNSGVYAVFNTGTLTVTGSVFSTNAGGALYNSGPTAAISDSMFSGNTVPGGGYGAALLNSPPLNQSSVMTVSGCTIVGNSAGVGDIGISSGGGIANSGALTVNNSTIAGNRVTGYGGGIYNAATLTLSNSTVAGNTALSPLGLGGGIYGDYYSNMTLLSSTIAGNSADTTGGGLYIYANTFNHNSDQNLLLAGNRAPMSPDLSGRLFSMGHNLIQDPTGGSGFDSTDLLTVDPLLGSLAGNGGPTQTMALLPGSPAIDAGDNTGAPMWDQRGPGFPRIVNGTIDIGAFEVQNGQATTAAFQVTAPAKVFAGTPFTITVAAVDDQGNVVTGYTGTVHFTTTDPDPGVVLPADYTFTAADAGVHTFNDTGLGETTLLTRGYQSLTVTDTADGSIIGSATVKVKHLRHHDGSSLGVPAGQDLAAADRVFAALMPEDFGLLSSPQQRHRETGGLWWLAMDGQDL